MFCPHCGTEQKCLACATPFQTEGKFCSECGVEKGKTGAEQVANATVEQVDANPKQESNQVPEQVSPVSEPIPTAQEPVSASQTGVNQPPEPPQQKEPIQQQVNNAPPVNNHRQATNQTEQTKSRTNQTTASRPKKKRKWPLFLVIAVLIGAAVAAYFFYFNNGGAKTPEEAVKGFVEAMDERDAEKIAPYIMPAVTDEVIDNIDFNEIPKGTEIKLVRFGDIEYERDTMVEVEARIAVRIDGEEDVGTLQFELIQMKNKWYIVEVYDERQVTVKITDST